MQQLAIKDNLLYEMKQVGILNQNDALKDDLSLEIWLILMMKV